MSTDSHGEALPLAAALLTWSDPALLEAIRLAESRFAPDELESLGETTLANVTRRRMQPRKGRVIYLADQRFGALHRAWDELLDAFRLLMEAGSIHLTGRLVEPLVRAEPEALPAAWATHIAIDPRGASVFFENRTYTGVTVTRAAPSVRASPDGETTAAAPGAADAPLNLRAALEAWSDPVLLKAVMQEERPFSETKLARLGRPQFTTQADRLPPRASWLEDDVLLARINAAWRALDLDFKHRVSRGDLHMDGVMVQPTLTTERVEIPGAWAAECRFDYSTGSVAIADRKYTAVMVSRVRRSPQQPRGDAGSRPDEVDTFQASAPPETQQSQGGRPSDELVVEDGLRRHWDHLKHTNDDNPGSRPVMTVLARALRKRLLAEARAVPGMRVPSEETIRKHASKVYPRVLGEKGGRQGNAQ